MRLFIYFCIFLMISNQVVAETIDDLEAELSIEAEKLPTPTKNNPEIINNYGNQVILQGLNKITARSELLTAKIGSTIIFGKLEIVLKKCWYAPEDEPPESKVLLEIIEHKSKEEKQIIFNGWMFASSPAISALEHPVYDISVIKCSQGN